MPAQPISHYAILETLGEGGIGIDTKAEDLTFHRTVARKPRKLLRMIHGGRMEF